MRENLGYLLIFIVLKGEKLWKTQIMKQWKQKM